MAEITKPMALDESLNTTESSPRNIADVLAQGIGNLVTVVSRISQQTVYDELDKLNDVNVTSPANNDVLKYNSNTQKWENGQGGGSSSCEELIAPVETSTTASQSYAIGEQFILNGVLYTATANISAGGTIVIDGNCTASDSVTEQIANAGGLPSNMEYGIQATNGSTRTITLSKNYSAMGGCILQVNSGSYAGSFFVKVPITFVSPNQISFSMVNLQDQPSSATYNIAYIFWGTLA